MLPNPKAQQNTRYVNFRNVMEGNVNYSADVAGEDGSSDGIVEGGSSDKVSEGGSSV